MRGYPDGMQRITLVVAVFAALVLPAAADPPTGWQTGSGATGTLTVLSAVSSSVAYAGGADGVVMRTNDGGRTWSATASPSGASVVGLSAADSQVAFALDARGEVQRTSDAGATWTTLAPAGGIHPLALEALPGNRLLLAGRRSLLFSSDGGDSFTSVTPKLAKGDAFRGVDRAGSALTVFGPRALLVSGGGGRGWRHLRLPHMARGDAIFTADFVTARRGYVLTNFRRLFRTADAGHHWTELLGAAGAGQDIAFADARRGWIAAPGFANRFDGVVLHTTDGGVSWRPQVVASGFASHVAAAGTRAFAIANEGTGLFATADAGEAGTALTVGFRPVPRVARRGHAVRIRGRISRRLAGVGVAVSMHVAGRWIARYVRTNGAGVFVAKFKAQRRSAFVAQIPSGNGHGSAATGPVFVRVVR